MNKMNGMEYEGRPHIEFTGCAGTSKAELEATGNYREIVTLLMFGTVTFLKEVSECEGTEFGAEVGEYAEMLKLFAGMTEETERTRINTKELLKQLRGELE